MGAKTEDTGPLIMKITSVILLIALLGVAWHLHSQQQLLGEQKQQIQTLNQELTNKSMQEAFTLQAQCSEVARKFLSSKGWKPDAGDEFKNHFNLKLKKCFILVTGYLPNDDFVTIDLYDALEGKHYATYNGHHICDVVITRKPDKCALDSGSIWLDGDDSRTPADFTAGFRGLRFGGGTGDETTQKTFLNHIQPFMNE